MSSTFALTLKSVDLLGDVTLTGTDFRNFVRKVCLRVSALYSISPCVLLGGLVNLGIRRGLPILLLVHLLHLLLTHTAGRSFISLPRSSNSLSIFIYIDYMHLSSILLLTCLQVALALPA